MFGLLSSDLLESFGCLQVCSQNEDDMGGQSFLINENSTVGFSSILQTQGFVVGVGRVGKGFLGYYQVPIGSNVILLVCYSVRFNQQLLSPC